MVERELHFRVIREILSEDRRDKLILKDDKGPARYRPGAEPPG